MPSPHRVSTPPHLVQTSFAFFGGEEGLEENPTPFYPLDSNANILTASFPIFDQSFDLQLDTSQPQSPGRFIYTPPSPTFTVPVFALPEWVHVVQSGMEFENDVSALYYVFIPFNNIKRGDVTCLYDIVTEALIALHEGVDADSDEARELEDLLQHMHILMISLDEKNESTCIVNFSFADLQKNFVHRF